MERVLNTPEFLDLESTLEDVVDDLVLEISKDRRRSKTSKKGKAYGVRQMQTTYLDLCRNALNPIVRYVKAIQVGVVSKEMIEVMSIIVNPLVKKTSEVGLDQHARKLQSFQIVLQQIARSRKKRVSKDQQDSLWEVYWPLHETFELSMRGHCLAVANLLAFYQKLKKSKQVKDSEVRKLFAIGIPSLSMVRKSSIAELTSLTGIAKDRMAFIRTTARAFQMEWILQ